MRFSMLLVLEMSEGVAAPLEAKRLPFEGLRLGLVSVSSLGGVALVRERSNGRRGTGLYI